MRFVWLLGCIAAASTLSAAAQGSRTTIVGSWTGTAHENASNGRSDAYPVNITITRDGGSVSYPHLECGGSLSRMGGGDKTAEFIEHITYGQKNCLNGGRVSVSLSNGNLSWRWTGADQGARVVATATLTPTR